MAPGWMHQERVNGTGSHFKRVFFERVEYRDIAPSVVEFWFMIGRKERAVNVAGKVLLWYLRHKGAQRTGHTGAFSKNPLQEPAGRESVTGAEPPDQNRGNRQLPTTGIGRTRTRPAGGRGPRIWIENTTLSLGDGDNRWRRQQPDP